MLTIAWLICLFIVLERGGELQAGHAGLQVFEYLSTDLKKFMDRIGKGPNFPLDPRLIKVHCSERLFSVCSHAWCSQSIRSQP